MALQSIINKTLTLDGKTYTQQITVESDSMIRREVTLAAAKVGVLTVRTDANTGSLTMDAGHGITTGAKIDIFWVSGNAKKCQRTVTVGTVATNVVPIDGGIGDDLPAASTAVTVMIQNVVEIRFDGDDVKVLAVTAEAAANVIFAGADNAEDKAYLITQGGQVKEWYEGDGETNPVAGQTETQLFVTHSDSSGSKTIKITVATV